MSIESFNPRLSVFRNKSKPVGTMTFTEFIETVRSEKYATEIENVRRLARPVTSAREKLAALAKLSGDNGEIQAARRDLTGAEAKWKAAKSALPAVTISGLFPENQSIAGKKPEPHSGLIQVDFDVSENAESLGDSARLGAIRLKLEQCGFVAGYMASPSGGLKVFVRIPPNNETHGRSFDALVSLFERELGLIADRSTRNANRLCYFSSDPTAWLNPNVTEFSELAPEKKRKRGEPAEADAGYQFQYSAEEVRRALMSIPAHPPYDDWMKILSAVRSAVGEEIALTLLKEWSPEEKEGEYAKKINEYQDVTAGTLFFYARRHGWRPEIYYDNRNDRFYVSASTGEFRSYPGVHAKAVLRVYHTPDDLIDESLHRIRDESFVDCVINISGMSRGFHNVNGKRVLVPRGPAYITPAEGDWSITRAIISGMLGGETSEQYQWFIRWLAFSLQSFYSQKFQQAQVVAFIGPPATGKSLLQWIITMLLGGTVVDVIQKATGKTEFNGDWAEAAHLRVDDEFAENDRTTRASVQQTVKAVAVRSGQRIHPKGREAFIVDPFWRMTISCNPEYESLAVLPIFDESVEDKISLLWTMHFTMPMKAQSAEEKAALRAKLREEAPALICELLRLKDVPEEMRDPMGRFDLRAYCHPEALKQVQDGTTDGNLLDALWELCSGNEDDDLRRDGTAAEWLTRLKLKSEQNRWDWLNEKILGRKLSALARKWPKRVLVLREGGSRGKQYQICPPDTDNDPF